LHYDKSIESLIMEQKTEISPELSLELKQLTTKDFQLWSIAVLIVVVLTVGFVSLIAPNLVWRSGPVQVDSRFLPQLFSGFIVLIALFNVYLFDQRRRLNQTRDRLIRKLMAQEGSNSELCDPLTKLFSRKYVELLIPKETARADRDQKPITFVLVSLSNMKSVMSKFGTVAGDHLLLVFSQLLKSTLRGSDIVARYGNEEFLLLLPDTGEVQAHKAVLRLRGAVERWNESTAFPYKVEIHAGCASYVTGMVPEQVIADARQGHAAGSPAEETPLLALIQ
jgi:diguanylate cyclase (GGDEF)-like protein